MKNLMVYQDKSTTQNTYEDLQLLKPFEFYHFQQNSITKTRKFLSSSNELPKRIKNKTIKRLSIPQEPNQDKFNHSIQNPQQNLSLKINDNISQINEFVFYQEYVRENKLNQITVKETQAQNQQIVHFPFQKRLRRVNSVDFQMKLIKQNAHQIRKKIQKDVPLIKNDKIKSIYKSVASTERLTIKQRLQKIQKHSKKLNVQSDKNSIKSFQFLSLLGTGHESQVFLARHTITKMLFAVKWISKERIKRNCLQQNLFRELKIHSFLNHRNIVTLYKILNDQNNIYMIMEYATGGTVLSELKNAKIFSQQKTSNIIRQIAQGLKFMHDNNIIHRDLKLQNIVISQGIAKIADFGCSVHSFRSRRTLLGSPVYLSPEQLNHLFYGKKTDIWSIGVMTFQMLFGYSPFQRQIISCLNNNDRNVQLVLKCPSFSSVSQSAKDFLQKCLQNQSYKRMDIDQVLNHPFINPLKQK